MPSYKFTYFNVRARGEVSRLALSAAGQQFEDIRLTQEEWPKEKAKVPLGQLPMMEVDGKKLTQSNAIARYLAREHGLYAHPTAKVIFGRGKLSKKEKPDLYGNGKMEMTDVDAVIDTAEDGIIAAVKFFFEKDGKRKAENKKDLTEKFLPKFLAFINGMLEQNSKGWIVGSKLTIADLAVYNVMDFIRGTTFSDKKVEEFLKDQPSILSHRKRVEEYNGIREYLAKRPDTLL